MEQRRAEAAAEEQAAAAAASLDGIPRPLPAIKKKPRLVIARQTQTEFLLRDLPIESLDDVQLVCASATVGRTMRRQLMQILDKNSADAAATLVTGNDDPRVKSKNVDRRKSVLLPEKLRHAYRVVELDDDDTNNTEVENEEESPYNEREEELHDHGNIIMPSSPLTTMAVRNEDTRVKHTMDALWNTMMMSETEAKPIIIFPGRMGVERVQQELMSRGANDVRTLRSLDGKRRARSSLTEDEDSPAAEERDNSIIKWKTIPIYIIGERFARGLDLPDVEYVFMLSPPSSAAGYAHMAGRTGRSGRSGTAITLVRPRNNEVQRLAAIAYALGLKFTASMSGSA
jgi:superfamily II DNA/RNA helicase